MYDLTIYVLKSFVCLSVDPHPIGGVYYHHYYHQQDYTNQSFSRHNEA